MSVGGTGQPCDGSAECLADTHMHGCYADKGNCDAPSEHTGGTGQPADKQWITDAIRENAKGCGAISPDGERACILPIDHAGAHGWEKGDTRFEAIGRALRYASLPTWNDAEQDDAIAALDAVAAELAEWQRRNETLTEDIRNCNQRSRQLAEWLAATREALETIQRFIEGRHKEGDTEYQVAIVARVALAGSVAAPHTASPAPGGGAQASD